MRDATHTPVWQVVGCSVKGASHVRSGLPNQDAMRWLPEGGVDATVIIAVADGKPARVECRTCYSTHNYRAPKSGAVAAVQRTFAA